VRRFGLLLCAALVLAALPAGGSATTRSIVGTKLATELTQLRPSAQRVRVIVVARPGHATAAAGAARLLGGHVVGRERDALEVAVPQASLERLAASASVSFVRRPLLHVPAAVGEEVAASHAGTLHNSGVKGAGVDIAIIDIGFAGYVNAEANGEIPRGTELIPNGCANVDATGHGIAVAEIVREMAPSATLHLVCVDSEIALSRALEWVLDERIPIVNHSITWLGGGRGDGVHNRTDIASPDTIAQRAYERGVLWVGAAGNYAQGHWSGSFSDPDHDTYANFFGSDDTNPFTIPAHSTTCASLVWDDWPRSDQDFNLFLQERDTGRLLASSEDVQLPGQLGVPTEEVCHTNGSAGAENVYVSIGSVPPAATGRFDLFITQGSLGYSVASGSVGQPAESPWVLAVGAVCWNGSGLRSYSSRGPTIDGRIKPDLVGYDSVSTTTFGPSADCNGGFMGTSAATPGVTGAAALVLQQRPDLRGHPQGLMDALQARTRDLGVAGNDDLFGAGALCLSSCGAQPPPPAPPPPPPPPPPTLKIATFVTAPKHPKAGRVFITRIDVRAGGNARVRSGTVSCAATVSRSRLRVLSAGFRGGLASCSWRIPRSARGKLVRGSVGLGYQGAKAARSFRLRIR